jgi:hypothetical protein
MEGASRADGSQLDVGGRGPRVGLATPRPAADSIRVRYQPTLLAIADEVIELRLFLLRRI